MKDLYLEFKKFDEDNPRVWSLFVCFAEEAILRGRNRLSTKLIIERIRWELYIETNSQDEFRINNNHTAYYARKWIEEYPLHSELFETRRVRCDRGTNVRDRRGLDLFEVV